MKQKVSKIAVGLKRESETNMKKIIIFITLILALVMCVASCDKMPGKDSETQHTHEFGEWFITQNATCVNDGVKVRYCSCGEKQSETVPKLSHNVVIDEAVEPTCTKAGLTEGKHCSECNEVIVAQEIVGVLGHDEEEHDAKIPTCSDVGNEAYVTCSRCDYTTYVELPMTINLHITENGVCIGCGLPESTSGLEYSLNSDGNTYTVTGIGDCIATDIVIGIYNGRSVINIGEDAFYACTNLTNVTIGNSVTSIGNNAFTFCASLTNVTIPDSVTSIGQQAFSLCLSLRSVTIGNDVTSIGDATFFGCSSLTSVTIGNSVTSIGNNAFSNCSSLKSITIPDSVADIGDAAFVTCTSITSIIVDKNNENYKSIDGNLYTKDGKTLIQYAVGKTDTSFTVPNSVTSISIGAFYNCTSLTSVTIPDSVADIGDAVFAACTSITSIIVDENNENYKSIDGNLYTKDGKNLIQYAVRKTDTSFTVPNSVTSIGIGAFNNCTSLVSITIPDSVTSIGEGAFEGCTSLIYNEYDNACYLGNDNNPYIVLVKAKSKDITSCDIDDDTKVIYTCAFSNCSSLTSITIPDSVTSIGDYAFEGCTSLTSITILDSVTSIGNYAFRDCTSLESIILPDSVTNIGIASFQSCSSLTSVIIPDSVTSIDSGAFDDCQDLSNVTFDGTIKQWDEISKKSYWNSNTGNYTIYCTDGTISKDGTVTYY